MLTVVGRFGQLSPKPPQPLRKTDQGQELAQSQAQPQALVALGQGRQVLETGYSDFEEGIHMEQG